jgi:hypothetical protein
VRVVGLDLSLTATGIASDQGTSCITPSKNMSGAERLIWIRRQVLDATHDLDQGSGPRCDTCRCWGTHPDLVCIEGYSFASRHGGERLGELGGVIRVELTERLLPWVELAPKIVKKLATGRGNAAKEEVFAAAIRRLDYRGNSLDEADALWVREVALQHFGEPTAELPAKHLEALEGIEWPEIPGLAASIASHPAGSGV